MIWIKIIIVILGFMFVGNATITLFPFSFRMEEWKTAIGLFLVLIGIIFITADSDRRALDKLRQEVNDEVRKIQEESLKRS